jgi:hypothetical protein
MQQYDCLPADLIPSKEEVEKIFEAKLDYEAAVKTPDKDAWCKANFTKTPWGRAWLTSRNCKDRAKQPNSKSASLDPTASLRCLLVAIAIDWPELIEQLRQTLRLWGLTAANVNDVIDRHCKQNRANGELICKCIASAVDSVLARRASAASSGTAITEAVEKHDKLNNKLFTKENLLKEQVRDKLLEIVDEFLTDLKEQDIQIKVDDILLICSNASYNYTKDSDIDLHILANSKATKYSDDVASSLYSAYRSLFNKQLDISMFNIPVELFVETESSARVSNGIYSVKKNKWLKKPEPQAIPEIDKEALTALTDTWRERCETLIDSIKADELKDEKKVVKLIDDIYTKLRKKGISKGEYSIENLAFKELRNDGYLDKLKDYRNELVSKRLSLEERLDVKTRRDFQQQIARIAHTQPILQDNGIFYIYNVKEREVGQIVRNLQALPFVSEVCANETGKYDFSDYSGMAAGMMPKKYYSIRGNILETF